MSNPPLDVTEDALTPDNVASRGALSALPSYSFKKSKFASVENELKVTVMGLLALTNHSHVMLGE
jgi:hypothetical protein